MPASKRFVTLLIAAMLTVPAASAADMSLAQSDETPCSESVDPAMLKEMVDQCLEVSPAARPPCNGENSCEMIESEIRRGCAMLTTDAPEFCAEYAE